MAQIPSGDRDGAGDMGVPSVETSRRQGDRVRSREAAVAIVQINPAGRVRGAFRTEDEIGEAVPVDVHERGASILIRKARPGELKLLWEPGVIFHKVALAIVDQKVRSLCCAANVSNIYVNYAVTRQSAGCSGVRITLETAVVSRSRGRIATVRVFCP